MFKLPKHVTVAFTLTELSRSVDVSTDHIKKLPSGSNTRNTTDDVGDGLRDNELAVAVTVTSSPRLTDDPFTTTHSTVISNTSGTESSSPEFVSVPKTTSTPSNADEIDDVADDATVDQLPDDDDTDDDGDPLTWAISDTRKIFNTSPAEVDRSNDTDALDVVPSGTVKRPTNTTRDPGTAVEFDDVAESVHIDSDSVGATIEIDGWVGNCDEYGRPSYNGSGGSM